MKVLITIRYVVFEQLGPVAPAQVVTVASTMMQLEFPLCPPSLLPLSEAIDNPINMTNVISFLIEN
jgi:hypothetical protein